MNANFFADARALIKPRISAMVLFTVAVGAVLASRNEGVDWVRLAHTLLGVALAASSSSALNQFLERDTDRLMRRTENRPLPAGRMKPATALVLGVALGIAGLGYLSVTVPWAATATTTFTLISYVCIYTPLKRTTSLNTLVGAVPGALPPLIGWTSVTGRFDREGLALFLILFLWQVPHFLAIAWMYREDYARAGLRMLPTIDREGAMTGRQMLGYAWTLLVVSLWPLVGGGAGPAYGVGAIALGAYFVYASYGFLRNRSREQARRVLHASLVYLPALLALMLAENWLGPTALAAVAVP